MKIIKTFLLIFLTYISYAQTYTWDTIKLNEFVVTGSYNAVRTTPFTIKNIEKPQIDIKSQNVEPAVLLSTTPSIIYYSDNGTGMGYLYFRMRGLDQSKLNSSFNGVPLNEPEDHNLFYNNSSFLTKSVSNIQIIRGVGLSKPGISSHGGSIEFSPLEFLQKDTTQFEAEFVFGSYKTKQFHFKTISDKLFFNASVGYTDGFRYNSYNKTFSGFYGYTKDIKKHNFTLYGFASTQANGMAWLGENKDTLEKYSLRYNTNTNNENDKFTNVHNQLNWKIGKFKTTIYHTYLRGMYTIDLQNFGYDGIDTTELKSHWFGLNTNYNYKRDNYNLNFGISTYNYRRYHFGFNSEYLSKYDNNLYSNVGIKNNISPYIKGEYRYDKLIMYGDIQYRYISLNYKSYSDTLKMNKQYNFLNWSAGFTYKLSETIFGYVAMGLSNREPKRYDYFSGLEYYTGSNLELTHETVNSFEVGLKKIKNNSYINVNFYYMQFDNEMVLTGEVGGNSLSLSNINANHSYRKGIEFDYNKQWNKLDVSVALNISSNRINWSDTVYVYETEPVMTPKFSSYIEFGYKLSKGLKVGISHRYNSMMYIDLENTSTKNSIYTFAELPSFNVINAYLSFNTRLLDATLYVNNVTNKTIYANGVVYPLEDGSKDLRYFPMALRNFMLIIKF